MGRFSNLSKGPKAAAILGAIFVVLMAVNMSRGDGGGSPSLPTYEVSQTSDSSFGAVKRYVIEIVLPETSATADQRMAIAEREIESLKSGRPFNAATARFWDSRKAMRGSVAYGSITYAPGGDWGAAPDVETGDYDTMEFSVD